MFQVATKFVYRIPNNSMGQVDVLSDVLENGKELRRFLKTKDKFLLSLKYANFSFYKELEAFLENEEILLKDKAQETVFKYYLRFTYRCTPFGFFSSVGNGAFSDHYQSPDRNEVESTFKITSGYLRDKVERFILADKSNLSRVIYFSNDTIYRSKEDSIFHYFERKNKAVFLSKFESNEAIDFVIDKCRYGVEFGLLVKDFSKFFDVTVSDCEGFINELILNDILIDEFNITFIDQDYLSHIVEICEEKQLKPSYDFTLLKSCVPSYKPERKKTFGFDDKKAGDLLSGHQIHPDDFFIQTFNSSDFKIESALKRDIEEAIEFLESTHEIENVPHIHLKKFASKFERAFGNGEVSIAEALDPVYGIGYPRENADSSSELFKEVDNYGNTEAFNSRLLINQLNITELYSKALKRGDNEIIINTNAFIKTNKHLLKSEAYTFGTYLRGSRSEYSYYLNVVASGNINSLVGRYNHFDAPIEVTKDRNIICADINHLTRPDLANTLEHQNIMDYSISVITPLSAKKYSITLSDLYLRMVDGELVLFSKKLNKIVVPILGSPHNYENGSVDVYKFLCDYQFRENIPSLKWNWGELNNAVYLPRVKFKNVILSKETWNLRIAEKDLENESKFFKKFNELHSELCLPNLFEVSKGDQTITIDLSIKFSRKIFYKYSKKRFGHIRIEESFNKNLDNNNELILSLFNERNSASYEFKASSIDWCTSSNRSNIEFLGESWIYVKVYLNYSAVSKFLDLFNNLAVKNKINFFFIRYEDAEGFHLRIRVQNDFNNYTKLFSFLNGLLIKFFKDGLIYSYKYDNYYRELDRYGPDTIELSEAIFVQESQILQELWSLERGEEFELLFILKMVIDYLSVFYQTDDQLEEVISQSAFAFKMEFEENKELIKFANRLFSEVKFKLYDFTNSQSFNDAIVYDNVLEKLSLINAKYTSIDQKKTIVFSHVHMLINRGFSKNQRMKEWILYEVLNKYMKFKKFYKSSAYVE